MALTQVNTSGITDATVANADLANEAVNEAKLQISNAGTNGQYLQKQSGNTGGLTWADVPAGVGGATGVDFNDNVKIRSGTGNDLEIYHDGTDDVIHSTGTSLRTRSNIFRANNAANDAVLFRATAGGNFEAFYDGSKKLETKAQGVQITGHTYQTDGNRSYYGTSDDLSIYHDGSNSRITDSGTGKLILASNEFNVNNAASSEYMITAVEDGAVELYYNGSKKFETYNGGCQMGGDLSFSDSQVANFGTGSDLQIYHNGSHSYIHDNGTGGLLLRSNNFHVTNAAGTESIIHTTEDTSVELYYNNGKRFETTSAGCSVPSGYYLDVPHDSGRIRLGAGNDLEFYHNGTDSLIVNNTGVLKLAASTGGVEINTADGHAGLHVHDNGNVELYYNNTKQCETSTNGLAFPSGKGIDFSAQTASSGTGVTVEDEVLDHYEKGQWTPFFYGSSTAGTFSYSSRPARYVRIGDLVWINMYIAGGSLSGAGGDLMIGGLPYNLEGSPDAVFTVGYAAGFAEMPDNSVLLVINGGSNTLRVMKTAAHYDGSTVGLSVSSDSMALVIGGCYSVS